MKGVEVGVQVVQWSRAVVISRICCDSPIRLANGSSVPKDPDQSQPARPTGVLILKPRKKRHRSPFCTSTTHTLTLHPCACVPPPRPAATTGLAPQAPLGPSHCRPGDNSRASHWEFGMALLSHAGVRQAQQATKARTARDRDAQKGLLKRKSIPSFTLSFPTPPFFAVCEIASVSFPLSLSSSLYPPVFRYVTGNDLPCRISSVYSVPLSVRSFSLLPIVCYNRGGVFFFAATTISLFLFTPSQSPRLCRQVRSSRLLLHLRPRCTRGDRLLRRGGSKLDETRRDSFQQLTRLGFDIPRVSSHTRHCRESPQRH